MTIFENGVRRTKLAGQAMWFAGWFFVTCFAAYLKPDPSGHGTHQQLGLPPCPSVLLFDRPCPGCGLTTSWTALVHGQIGFAFHAHAIGPFLYLLFTVSAWLALYGFLTGKRLMLEAKIPSRIIYATAILFIGFGVVRMAVTPGFGTQKERLYVITRGS
jgi:hypothetical protein